MSRVLDVDCCVAGGGPAGVMAGLLFARAGCKTVVLEKHGDFLRDFRGDTVHPSTLEIMKELGLLEAFLSRPHQRLRALRGEFSGHKLQLADFSSLSTACKFIVFMPQWHFLNFVSDAASSLPTFSMEMNTEVVDLIEEGGRVSGVRARGNDGPLEVRSTLVIGADGRHSDVRARAGLKVEDIGAPIDVLWFKIPREGGDAQEPLLNAGAGRIVITIDRGTYYQCALVVAKGQADAVKARGLGAFRASVVSAAPRLGATIDALQSFDDVKLLTVVIDRLERWSRPGLVMIGDSAHAMSPIGGVGINLAIQDAVAAANLLAGRLADGSLSDVDLDKVRARRLWPTQATQFIQVQAQNRIIKPILDEGQAMVPAPLPLRLVAQVPWLQRRFAALVGIGVRPEHVRSPERYAMVVPSVQR